MEKTKCNYEHFVIFIFSLLSPLIIAAFILCILGEFKKSKVEDVKLNGKLCELPGNEAYGLGSGALICSSVAQIIGNVVIFVRCCSDSRERKSNRWTTRPVISNVLLVVSWISFVISAILISTASSMNRRQPYGKGWLGGECYLVKDGVFIGASFLVLFSFGCNLASVIITLLTHNKFHVSTDEKTKKNALFTTCIKQLSGGQILDRIF